MKLLTPRFQRSVAVGTMSPYEVSESSTIPVRVAKTDPADAVSVPAILAAFRPNQLDTLTDNCPPSTGCANVYDGARTTRSPCPLRLRFRFTFTEAGILPAKISFAAATLPNAATLLW